MRGERAIAAHRAWSAAQTRGARHAGTDDLVVELEGRLSGERDLDADAGALLVSPTRIVATHPFDQERLQVLRARMRS